MRVLVACEFSGIVREAFAAQGHDAWSCDLIPTEVQGKHIQGDVLDVLGDGWDLMIAHPPCTRLTVTANRWYKPEYADRFPRIHEEREEAIEFFMALANAPIDRIAVENPVGIISTRWRKPDQIIQPYWFGDKVIKKTCLWLKNLPPLVPTQLVEPEYKIYNAKSKRSGKSRFPILWTGKSDAKARSRFFPGVARAMAEQWGG